MLKKLTSFAKTVNMAPHRNFQHNGSAINLSICRQERTSVLDIRNELVAILDLEVVASSTMTKHRRQRDFRAISSQPLRNPR
jgi:hypothetical protein